MNTTYKIEISEEKKLRRASATIRNGAIQVKLPQRWPRAVKQEITADLVKRIQDKDQKERKLLATVAARQPRLTIKTDAELSAYVHQLNRETFNFPRLGKIQIGWSKYNHLAQVNLRTKTMTVSKYCLHNVPAHALKYLIVHELAHYLEAGHNKRFWNLVAQHVPDHRLQSSVIKAFHHQAVVAEEAAEVIQEWNQQDNLEYLEIKTQELKRQDIPPAEDLIWDVDDLLDPIYEPDFDFYADWSPPDPQPEEPETVQVEPVSAPPQNGRKKSGPATNDKPGILQQVKQLLLWGS